MLVQFSVGVCMFQICVRTQEERIKKIIIIFFIMRHLTKNLLVSPVTFSQMDLTATGNPTSSRCLN
uniref:Uncharacterized protein n=1 Tax=Anguilla anguilla TaxID=7936 RepID=A0A0E9RUM6_ANGAN